MKDILVYLDSSDTSKEAFSLAIPFTRAYNAELCSLYVNDWPDQIHVVDSMPWPSSIEKIKDRCNEQEIDVKKWFDAKIKVEDISVDWCREEGSIDFYIKIYSCYFDLSIFGQSCSYLAQDALFNTGRPVLVIPSEYKSNTIGKKVLVAWHSYRREAVRALYDSFPLLRQADYVELLTVGKPDQEVTKIELGAHGSVEHLLRHGIKINRVNLNKQNKKVGEVISKYALDNAFDLIVMGAYGHSRLSEIILGGTTKYMLENSNTPLFMSH